MRRTRMSTGAWIFTGLICAAVIAPATVYAATITKVALASSNGANVATVTAQHQLLTTAIPPSQVISIAKVANSAGCTPVYSPPQGKAIVVTSVVYNYGSGTEGTEQFGGLLNRCGSGATVYDQIDEVHKFGSLQHTFPTGVPMAGVVVTNSGSGPLTVFVEGYLIASSALPAHAASHTSTDIKALTTGH